MWAVLGGAVLAFVGHRCAHLGDITWLACGLCVYVDQDVPVLRLSDHLFLAVGFYISVYFWRLPDRKSVV